MIVPLNFDSYKDFELFMKAFNNSIIAYNDIISSLILGIEVSTKWDKLIPYNEEDEQKLRDKLNALVCQYQQLKEFEDSLI